MNGKSSIELTLLFLCEMGRWRLRSGQSELDIQVCQTIASLRIVQTGADGEAFRLFA